MCYLQETSLIKIYIDEELRLEKDASQKIIFFRQWYVSRSIRCHFVCLCVCVIMKCRWMCWYICGGQIRVHPHESFLRTHSAWYSWDKDSLSHCDHPSWYSWDKDSHCDLRLIDSVRLTVLRAPRIHLPHPTQHLDYSLKSPCTPFQCIH